MKRVIALFLLTFLTDGASLAASTPPLQTVPHVDLNRYMGDWYVIASIPYLAERDKVAAIERYEFGPDGKISNTFIFRKKSLTAPEQQWHAVGTVVNRKTNAEWRMQFFWPVKLAYLVIDLDPDYGWAVVGHPSRNYLWVLARRPILDDTVYQGILQRAADQGYDTSSVTKIPQPH
jgi:apolipoprotein D and lipocalin family protein